MLVHYNCFINVYDDKKEKREDMKKEEEGRKALNLIGLWESYINFIIIDCHMNLPSLVA